MCYNRALEVGPCSGLYWIALVLAAVPQAASADGIMLIQAGTFWMGADDGDPDEAPLHRVYVRDLREWTSSVLKPYPYRHDDGREPFTGAGRMVLRGASHDDARSTLRVTTLHSYDRRGAAAGHHHVGFRCATSEDLGGR